MESASGPEWRLAVEGLRKRYGQSVMANDGISLHVDPGEVYGLLGPNGAGKTTLVKQVIGLLKPTSGRITLGPFDLVAHPAAARQLCSYLPQAQMPIDGLRSLEAIELIGRIRGGDAATVKARAQHLIEQLDLGQWSHQLGARLSGGVRRLVGFAMVAVWPGRVAILDEPTNDVDPMRRRLLWDAVRALGNSGVAVVLVTHNVLEAEKTVDRLAIIDQGRLLEEGTPSSFKASTRDRLRLQLMLHPGAGDPDYPAFVADHTRTGHNLVTTIDSTQAGAAVAWARKLLDSGAVEEYALGATTLEDAYLRVTGHDSLDGHLNGS